jgi:hypothetical protein
VGRRSLQVLHVMESCVLRNASRNELPIFQPTRVVFPIINFPLEISWAS